MQAKEEKGKKKKLYWDGWRHHLQAIANVQV